MRSLNVHTLSNHRDEFPSISQCESYCKTCAENFPTKHILQYHMAELHQVGIDNAARSDSSFYDTSIDTLADTSNIVQLDGVDDSTVTNSIQRVISPANTPHLLSQDKVAPYILNKTKQLNNLARDASKIDFEIEITHETNVNVHCSAGFYLSVARPAFSNISKDFKAVVSGIPIRCEETRSEKDKQGSGVNWVFWFKVALNGSDTSLSSATVHIHNTQRLIQVQGGAAIWFVENVLRERFMNESRNKKIDIAAINKTFNLLSKNLLQKGSKNHACPECLKKFQSNTKTQLCQHCNLFFHGSKQSPCMKSHRSKCSQQSRPGSHSDLLSSQVASPQTSDIPACHSILSAISQTLPDTVNMHQSLTVQPPLQAPVSTSQSVSSRPCPSYAKSSLPQSTSCAQASSASPSSGQLPAIPLVSSPKASTAVTFSLPSFSTTTVAGPLVLQTPAQSLDSTLSVAQQKRTAKKNTVHNDSRDTEIAVLKQELVIVKTKLLQSEAECKDLVRKNGILSDSIRIYQGAQNGTSPGGFSDQSSINSLPSTFIPAANPLTKTIDRLINYFLDVIAGNKPEVFGNNGHHSSQVPMFPATESNTAASPPSSTTSTAIVDTPISSGSSNGCSPPSGPPSQYSTTDPKINTNPDKAETVLLEDCSMETIDEFTEEILLPSTSSSGLRPLNCEVLTIQ